MGLLLCLLPGAFALLNVVCLMIELRIILGILTICFEAELKNLLNMLLLSNLDCLILDVLDLRKIDHYCSNHS